MFDHLLRETKDRFLLPLARWAQPVHPIAITVASLAVGLLTAMLLMLGQYGWGLLGWALNRLLDGLDGAVARLSDQQSDLGGYLDILFDFIVYALIPVSLVVANPNPMNYLSLGFLLSTFYINAASWMFLAAIIEKRQHGDPASPRKLTTVAMPAGLIAGAETVIFFGLFILFPGYIAPLFILMGSLVLISIVQRVVWAVKHLD